MASKTAELTRECQRQFETCLYTSTTLFIWLKILRGLYVFFATAPLVFGSFATWKLLTQSGDVLAQRVAAVCALLAGLLPMIAAALKLEKHIEQCRVGAAEFTNLRDRFRQAALIASKKSFDEFETEVKALMKRLEDARKVSLTPPDFVFKLAQRKVKSGDYTFDVDEDGEGGSSTTAKRGAA